MDHGDMMGGNLHGSSDDVTTELLFPLFELFTFFERII